MADVAIFLSNPGHHVAMLAPVVGVLTGREVSCLVLSLCELRGFESPFDDFERIGAPVQALWPRWLRRRPAAVQGALGHSAGRRRALLRALSWHSVLEPALRKPLASVRLAALPNDAAFPYDRIAALLRRRRIPFVLVQEGIRFPIPIEGEERYGLAGATAIAAWGEGSAEHFRSIGVESSRIHVTGSPRFDRAPAPQRMDRRPSGSGSVRILLVTNPIDAQGFCTRGEKVRLVAEFVGLLRDSLEKGVARLTIRPHPGEGIEEYAERLPREDRDRVAFDTGGGLEDALARCDVAVVMASTVGLEALRRGIPLAVLPTPGHGHVFDYVDRGAALGLRLDSTLSAALLGHAGTGGRGAAGAETYLGRHLAHPGEATKRVAELMIGLAAR